MAAAGFPVGSRENALIGCLLVVNVPALAGLAAELAGGVQFLHALGALEPLGGALGVQGLQGFAHMGEGVQTAHIHHLEGEAQDGSGRT